MNRTKLMHREGSKEDSIHLDKHFGEAPKEVKKGLQVLKTFLKNLNHSSQWEKNPKEGSNSKQQGEPKERILM